MVDHGPIVFHLLCTPVIFFSIFFIYQQNRRHYHPFLQPYLFYVVFDGLGTLAEVFFRIVPYQLQSSGQLQGSYFPFISVILNLFALPIQALMIFFFITAVHKLLGRALNRWMVIVLWSVYILLFILTIIGVMLYVNNHSIALLKNLVWVTILMSSGYLIGSLVFGINSAIREKDRTRRFFYWVFILTYLASFLFQDSLLFIRLAGVWVTFLVLGTHLPVLFFLPRFLSENAMETNRNESDSQNITLFYKEKGVSKREQEIITYLVSGLSNKEIEEKLFISRRTVENHVYNIYRKLDVGNRVHLVRCIESRRARPGGD